MSYPIKDNIFVQARQENSPVLDLVPAYNAYSPYTSVPSTCLANSTQFRLFLTQLSNISSLLAPWIAAYMNTPQFDPIEQFIQLLSNLHPVDWSTLAASGNTTLALAYKNDSVGSGAKTGDHVVFLFWQRAITGPLPTDLPPWAGLTAYYDCGAWDLTSKSAVMYVPAGVYLYVAAVVVPWWSGVPLDVLQIHASNLYGWINTTTSPQSVSVDLNYPGVA